MQNLISPKADRLTPGSIRQRDDTGVIKGKYEWQLDKSDITNVRKSRLSQVEIITRAKSPFFFG
jgi:hypothetical protein